MKQIVKKMLILYFNGLKFQTILNIASELSVYFITKISQIGVALLSHMHSETTMKCYNAQ